MRCGSVVPCAVSPFAARQKSDLSVSDLRNFGKCAFFFPFTFQCTEITWIDELFGASF